MSGFCHPEHHQLASLLPDNSSLMAIMSSSEQKPRKSQIPTVSERPISPPSGLKKSWSRKHGRIGPK